MWPRALGAAILGRRSHWFLFAGVQVLYWSVHRRVLPQGAALSEEVPRREEGPQMLVDPRSESPDISEGGLWAGTSLSSKFDGHVGFFVLQCADLTMVRNTSHTRDQKAGSLEMSSTHNH